MRHKRGMVQSPAEQTRENAPDIRQRLLRAAQAQILAAGFHDTSVDQIARRAGASKQTIYAHFPSKEHLFQEVLRLTLEEAGQADEPDITALSFEDAVRAYIEWTEKSALNPQNLELYRANIAATVAFPQLAGELHHLRLTASHMGASLLAHPGGTRLPEGPPARLSSWLGVLAMAGPRALLGFSASAEERRARHAAIMQICNGGWTVPVSPVPVTHASDALAEPADHGHGESNSRIPAERWTELLRIAVRQFIQTGLRKTSVEEISATAQISKMTIYKRFGNKQGLFAAAVDQAVSDLLVQRPAITGSGDIGSALEAIALEQDRFTRQADYAALLRLMITEAPGHAAMIRHAWNRLTLPTQSVLAARLRQWHGEEIIHLIDPDIAAEQFLLLATRGNRRLTDTIPWDETEARTHAREVTTLFYR